MVHCNFRLMLSKPHFSMKEMSKIIFLFAVQNLPFQVSSKNIEIRLGVLFTTIDQRVRGEQSFLNRSGFSIFVSLLLLLSTCTFLCPQLIEIFHRGKIAVATGGDCCCCSCKTHLLSLSSCHDLDFIFGSDK